MAVTWASALGWRLRRQYLDDERAATVEGVVDRLVALPSWSGDAATSIRLRLARSTPGDVETAMMEGRVFATYAFRGATHLMTSSSAAVHLALRCAGRQWERSSWRSHYGIEPEEWPRLRATVREALVAGPLTQHELAEAVAKDPAYRHLKPAFADRSHTFLKPFGWQGDLCFSPSDGAPRFQLLESVPGWTGLAELDDAGPRAIRAYLAAYGPTTPDRIQYWLGEGLSAGRKRIAGWIDEIDAELATVWVDGVEALCLSEHVEPIATAAESHQVVLLPGSDQWVLGAGTSATSIVPVKHRGTATGGANLILIGGRVGGTWKVDRSTIRISWFDGMSAAPSSVATAADWLSQALGRELELESH
ncbi:hypothetical protein C4K88_04090 [Arthrobacter pityocampae]|uniref:Winged helix DNA-binding domain-containing protein n=1 Tax=Arthrobacter pityocampae TaxID=547334 RepID=A0A2S5IZ94_9MICC|nr:crosslink repair DNA glycosylase YcaQ family protein [Arthrobacter pityocampae]PPB49879.1 hypothetical protein C4K88_04090 [Arthrobacter pityocampae]